MLGQEQTLESEAKIEIKILDDFLKRIDFPLIRILHSLRYKNVNEMANKNKTELHFRAHLRLYYQSFNI